MLTQALLIGLISLFGQLGYAMGSLYTQRPIVLSPLVGLVLGDLQLGLEIGASLELLFMGAVSVGAYIPPDVNVGGVLATAFAITLGQGTDAAVALAMPIAVLSLSVANFLDSAMPFFLQFADKAATQGNDKKIFGIHWLMGGPLALFRCSIVALAYYLGAEQVQNLLNFVPDFIFDGMGVAAAILPAMGFAMLLRMIVNKQLIPFFVLGFVLSSYLNVPVLGVAIIAVIIAIEKTGFLEKRPAAAVAGLEEGADDDF